MCLLRVTKDVTDKEMWYDCEVRKSCTTVSKMVIQMCSDVQGKWSMLFVQQ